MSAIIQNNATVHYEALGRGKPVIFLHSWIGSWRYWVSSMQFVSSRHRSFAIDFWGYGASKKIPARYTLESQVNLLHDFVLQLGIDEFTLVGHGLGSIIASYYAADHPEIVDRLMLVSFPMGSQNANPKLQSLAPPHAAEWLFGWGATNKESRVDAAKADPQALTTAILQFEQVNWKQLINRLSVSTLWIQGQRDPAVMVPSDECLSHMPESAYFVIFLKSGHYPMLDEPNHFHRLLGEFLKIDPGADPREITLKPMWKRRVR